MIEVGFGFVVSVFIAGLLMFLAPCTLPLVPAYLAFISGVHGDDSKYARRQIVLNAVGFVAGFTVVFVLLGVLLGFFGSSLGVYRVLFSQLGGLFLIFFGTVLLGVLRIPLLTETKQLSVRHIVTPGNPLSAGVMGAAFALGWSPCIGPILASVLLLASTTGTVVSGGFLLGVFSLGLGIPFVLTAIFYKRMTMYINRYAWVSTSITKIAGLLLILLGVLMVIERIDMITVVMYEFFDFINYEGLLEYL